MMCMKCMLYLIREERDSNGAREMCRCTGVLHVCVCRQAGPPLYTECVGFGAMFGIMKAANANIANTSAS